MSLRETILETNPHLERLLLDYVETRSEKAKNKLASYYQDQIFFKDLLRGGLDCDYFFDCPLSIYDVSEYYFDSDKITEKSHSEFRDIAEKSLLKCIEMFTPIDFFEDPLILLRNPSYLRQNLDKFSEGFQEYYLNNVNRKFFDSLVSEEIFSEDPLTKNELINNYNKHYRDLKYFKEKQGLSFIPQFDPRFIG